MITVKKLGEQLVEKKVITEAQLQEALQAQATQGQYVGQIFIEKGWITEEELGQSLAEQYKMPFVKLKETTIDKATIEKVPLKVATHYKIIPTRLDGNKLTVAIHNPQDLRLLDELRLALHQKFLIDAVLAGRTDIEKAIEKYYGLAAQAIDEILVKKEQSESSDSRSPQSEVVEDIQSKEEAASVITVVNQILFEAHELGATDIHFEPYRGKIRLRYRVDGILRTVETSDSMRKLFPAIISRIKVLCNLNLVERRVPQDGRASVKVGDKKIDLRTSVIPTPNGESVVIRILPNQMLFDLKELGFRGDGLARLDQLCNKKYGIIFVTGPTGSGKSTTLYACLKKINTQDLKIITIEDPVEYEMEGITQVQVNPKVGLSFAQGLRSMLRHDPDVMMVGEVRDLETAELAVRIALTGHLVFSTLHTNDAATSASRLIDMGIDPFLVVSSVQCFIAQRLVRLVCQGCKKEVDSEWPEAKKIFVGTGCKSCQGKGLKGRTVIYELLLLTPEIKKIILRKGSADEIRQKAIEEGMKTLYEVGWEKVREGLTTPEEVLRVTANDEWKA